VGVVSWSIWSRCGLWTKRDVQPNALCVTSVAVSPCKWDWMLNLVAPEANY